MSSSRCRLTARTLRPLADSAVLYKVSISAPLPNVQVCRMRRTTRTIRNRFGIAVLVAAFALPAHAQDAQLLVREAKNPLANLINVQFIYDALLNVGPDKNVQDTLTIQPVFPFAVNDNWSVITRTVLPLISQPATVRGGTSTNGLGDTQFAAFLSPARTGRLVWGVGPVL